MIDKAIIPVAGLGMRMRPISRAVPKALLPLAKADGRVRPVVHHVCAEAVSAGVREVALIVSPGHAPVLRDYFDAARSAGDADLPQRIEYIPAEPKGFGYAVARGEGFVRGESFLLLLGDHVHLPREGCPSCGSQVAQAHARFGGAAMIGMQAVGPEALPRVGAARGEPVDDAVYRCTGFLEKPAVELARQKLRTSGLGEDRFLAHAGIYLFTGEIFDCLRQVAVELPEGRELELAAAQQRLLQAHPRDYYLVRIAGRTFDTGTPETYVAALDAFRRAEVRSS